MKWLAIALLVCACKKKKDEAVAPPPPPPKPAVAKPVPKPLPLSPAKVGPAYVSVGDQGVLALTPAGWKPLAHPGDKWVHSTTISLGGDGSLWAVASSRVWKLEGTDFTEQRIEDPVDAFVAGSDGSLWFISGGHLHHYVDGKDTPITLPTADPAHTLTADASGIWFATLDRTYHGIGDTWTGYDVPGVTGAQVDILEIQARDRDAYVLTTNGVLSFDENAWHPVPDSKIELGSYPSLIAGPSGRFAVNASPRSFVGDTARGMRKVDTSSGGSVVAIDARARVWVIDDDTIRVLDDDLKEIKRWTPGDTPALAHRVSWLVVGAGGPVRLDQGERAAGTVTGKVEGSAAGLAMRVCQQQSPEYEKAPCDGVPGTREGKTAAGGTFSIADVAVGPQFFYVQRGGRWRDAVPAKECCADLQPEGTVDVGTLTLR